MDKVASIDAVFIIVSHISWDSFWGKIDGWRSFSAYGAETMQRLANQFTSLGTFAR